MTTQIRILQLKRAATGERQFLVVRRPSKASSGICQSGDEWALIAPIGIHQPNIVVSQEGDCRTLLDSRTRCDRETNQDETADCS